MRCADGGCGRDGEELKRLEFGLRVVHNKREAISAAAKYERDVCSVIWQKGDRR